MEAPAAPRRAPSSSAAERRPSSGAPPTGDPVMEWRRAVKRYPGAAAPALNDVSFSVRPGEIVVLVGPNGSGKTTAMEMVSGLRLPTSGEVRVNGGPVRASASQRALVGVQLQETSLPQRLKVREAIRGGSRACTPTRGRSTRSSPSSASTPT